MIRQLRKYERMARRVLSYDLEENKIRKYERKEYSKAHQELIEEKLKLLKVKPIREVTIDGLAVLKIIKHCSDNPDMIHY